jgi:hypothetical protein
VESGEEKKKKKKHVMENAGLRMRAGESGRDVHVMERIGRERDDAVQKDCGKKKAQGTGHRGFFFLSFLSERGGRCGRR